VRGERHGRLEVISTIVQFDDAHVRDGCEETQNVRGLDISATQIVPSHLGSDVTAGRFCHVVNKTIWIEKLTQVLGRRIWSSQLTGKGKLEWEASLVVKGEEGSDIGSTER